MLPKAKTPKNGECACAARCCMPAVLDRISGQDRLILPAYSGRSLAVTWQQARAMSEHMTKTTRPRTNHSSLSLPDQSIAHARHSLDSQLLTYTYADVLDGSRFSHSYSGNAYLYSCVHHICTISVTHHAVLTRTLADHDDIRHWTL
eukprot:scpid95455/ scgid26783/ 